MSSRIYHSLIVILSIFSSFILLPNIENALYAQIGNFGIDANEIPCCDSRNLPAIVWSGKNPLMTIQDLAAYCAPIMWFSPDEPLLNETEGKGIMLPEPFPFERSPTSPMVYYRLRNILIHKNATGPAYLPDTTDKNNSIIDLRQIVGVDLDFFFYYHAQEGFHGHDHDVESAEFKVTVWLRDSCLHCPYNLVVTRVVGRAHGLLWYNNTLEIDEYARFPMHILVEEGKHANCTDKNGDGYYTPGFDANKRVNDAWRIRDVLRTGTLVTGGFHSWMAKVRRDEHRVFPPLPGDSHLREQYSIDGVYAPDNAIYILRSFPSAEKAEPDLVPFITDKGYPHWPSEIPDTDIEKFRRWVDAESSVKSLSIALRYDGDPGFSFVFPLFIVKNFEDPLAGGFLVNRMYLKDKNLRDLAWTLLYTTSASRWFDGYLSAGYEWDVIDLAETNGNSTKTEGEFVLETGVKLRINIAQTPFKFMTKLTDFWGFRIGVKNTGFVDINQLTYVLEIGAGTW